MLFDTCRSEWLVPPVAPADETASLEDSAVGAMPSAPKRSIRPSELGLKHYAALEKEHSKLAAFQEVTEDEARGVGELMAALGLDATAQPMDVGGEVALLRWLRFKDWDVKRSANAYRHCLARRTLYGMTFHRGIILDANHKVVGFEGDAPGGLAELFAVSNSNLALGLDRSGNLISWIGTQQDIARLISLATDESEWKSRWRLAFELLHILLDQLSWKQRIVTERMFVFDCHDVQFGHRRLINPFKLAMQAAGEPVYSKTVALGQ